MKINILLVLLFILSGCSVQTTKLKLVELSRVSKQQAYDSYKNHSVLASMPGRIVDGDAKKRWSYGDIFYKLQFTSTFDLNKKQTSDVFFTAHSLRVCDSRKKIKVFDILNSGKGDYFTLFPEFEIRGHDLHKNPVNLCFKVKQESISGPKLLSNILVINKDILISN